MYSVPQSRQLTIFLCALGAGFLLGVLYDIFRTLRLSFTKSKAALIIFDTVYFLLCGIISFLFILAINKGEIRFYILSGEVIGWVFYYLSFGMVAIKITNAIVIALDKAKSILIRVASAPFHLIFKVVNPINEKLRRLFKKSSKKSQKIRKKYLQKLRIYVYNLFGIMSTRANTEQKGGTGRGKHKNKKKTQASSSR